MCVVHVCTCVFLYVCGKVWLCVRVRHVCVYVCSDRAYSVCVYVRVWQRDFMHTRSLCAHTSTFMPTNTPTPIPTPTNTHTHTQRERERERERENILSYYLTTARHTRRPTRYLVLYSDMQCYMVLYSVYFTTTRHTPRRTLWSRR